MKCRPVKFVNDLRVHAVIDELVDRLSHDSTDDQGAGGLFRNLRYIARDAFHWECRQHDVALGVAARGSGPHHGVVEIHI